MGRCAGEVITHTLKTVLDFPRVQMAQQLDLSTESVPLLNYFSSFLGPLCPAQTPCSSHSYNSSSWSDGKACGKVFFFYFVLVFTLMMIEVGLR